MFCFDLRAEYNQLNEQLYSLLDTPTTTLLKNMSLVIEDGIILTGKERKEYFQMQEIIGYDKRVPFYLVMTHPDSKFYGRKSIISLASQYESTSHSIIHQMKEEGLIDRKSISFSLNQIDKGDIYYGGIPGNVTQNLYQSSCKIQGKTGSYWDCLLTHVFIGNISYVYENIYYPVKEHMYFSTTQTVIEVPESFYKLIISNVFNKTIENHQCVMQKYGNHEIQCNCKIISQFPSITFIIENKAYTFDSQESFSQSSNLCTYMIVLNRNNDDWIIGIGFYKKYITTFDYDTKSVVFHSTQQIKEIILNTLFPMKKIVLWSLLIILIILLSSSRRLYLFLIRNKRLQQNHINLNKTYEAFNY